MKKIIIAASFVFAFVFAITPVLAKSENAGVKVNICHREDETGRYHLINVNVKAQPAHMNHGDGVPGGTVPGITNGNFSNDCSILITFTASDSLYYNGPTASAPLYGIGAISFTWDQNSGNVTGGYYNEIVPPTTGTVYYNVVTGGSVIGNNVHLVFDRTNPNTYHFIFDGTLTGNVLSGMMDGPYLFTATGI